MVTINIVAQSGHGWQAQYANLAEAKAAIPAIVREHGDIERVELLTNDGPVNLWLVEWERPAVTLGRKGGSATSDAKRKASAANGAKGGRPKKHKRGE